MMHRHVLYSALAVAVVFVGCGGTREDLSSTSDAINGAHGGTNNNHGNSVDPQGGSCPGRPANASLDCVPPGATGSLHVTICHVPPGNPDNAHTITVGAPGAAAHLAQHCDYCGPCVGGNPGDGSGGPDGGYGDPDGGSGTPDGGSGDLADGGTCLPAGHACITSQPNCCPGLTCNLEVCVATIP